MFYESSSAPLIDNLDKKEKTLSGNKKASFFFNKKNVQLVLMVARWWRFVGDCIPSNFEFSSLVNCFDNNTFNGLKDKKENFKGFLS